MLAGRQSLIRLVGKRRRDLPRDLLLKCTEQQEAPKEPASPSASIPNNFSDKDHPSTPSGDCTRSAGESSSCGSVESVECPVCGKSIRGSDYAVNMHLDLCLMRDKKRKLTQRTLLQLNFCTKSKRKLQNNESNDSLNNENTSDWAVEQGSKLESGHRAIEDEMVEDSEPEQEPSPTNEEMVIGIPSRGVANSRDAKCPEGLEASCSSPRRDDINDHGEVNAADALVALSTTIIKTSIVGRRFHKENEISEGDSVYILRDPGNEKDQQALKAVYSVAEPERILGYLPRELARYLSPLIDKCNLKYKGSVISVSNSFDAVPIELSCLELTSYTGMRQSDIHHIESLWSNVLRVVECGETSSFNTTRYQQNFLLMMKEVLNCCSDLFSDNEKSLLDHFQSMSNDSQRLFIRLYTRKGPWFRMSSISYPEIMDLQKATNELQLAGYFCSFSSLLSLHKKDFTEVLDVLNVTELREISNLLRFKKSINNGKKQDIINWLYESFEDAKNPLLLSMISERIGPCVKISSNVESLLWRIQRLFFLNGEQDLLSFLLVDFGMVKYPTYTCAISQPVFQKREELLAYEKALSIAQILDESIEEDNTELVIRCIQVADKNLHAAPEMPISFLSCFSTSYVYSKVVTLGVSFYERERRYKDAVKLLKGLLKKVSYGGKRGYWYLRLSLDLEHTGCVNESLLVAEEGILDPWVRAGPRIALQRRILRLGKPPRRWKSPSFAKAISRKIPEVHVRGRPLNCKIGTKNRYYGYDGTQCGVEQLALQYYAEEGGWSGVHAESGIWLTIFGLLMWDIIFSSVPDVFRTRFQTAPLDLGTDSFYLSREDLIEAQLQKIHAGMGEEILISSWEIHHGTACRGVNWDSHSLSDLRAAVSCIGGHCLASLCRHLAQDYRSWSRGMPDLLLWRFHGGEMNGGEAKLVEVKGPRDLLSEQQRAWMLLLMDCGFETEVCKVSAASKT